MSLTITTVKGVLVGVRMTIMLCAPGTGVEREAAIHAAVATTAKCEYIEAVRFEEGYCQVDGKLAPAIVQHFNCYNYQEPQASSAVTPTP